MDKNLSEEKSSLHFLLYDYDKLRKDNQDKVEQTPLRNIDFLSFSLLIECNS